MAPPLKQNSAADEHGEVAPPRWSFSIRNLCGGLAALILLIGLFFLPDLSESSAALSPRLIEPKNYYILVIVCCLLLTMRSTLAAFLGGLFLILCNHLYHSLLAQMGAIIEPEHIRLFFQNWTDVFETYAGTIQKSMQVGIITLISIVLLVGILVWGRKFYPKSKWALPLFLAILIFIPSRLVFLKEYEGFKTSAARLSIRTVLEAGSIYAIQSFTDRFDNPEDRPKFARRTPLEMDPSGIEEDAIVAFIMGESISARNMSVFGYERNTTPRLKARIDNPAPGYKAIAKQGLSYSPSSNDTNAQIYNLADHPFDMRLNKSAKLNIFSIAKTNGFEVSYFTSQVYKSFYKARPRFIKHIQYREINKAQFKEKSDDILLDFIPSPIPPGKQFFYIYQWGNHAPFIDRCVGQDDINIFEIAKDDINQTWRDEYDNGMRCWDKNTDAIIAKLTQQDRPVFVFLSADHAILLGEHGLRGHGHHYLETYIVPMVLYTNRPNHPATKAFESMVGTHFELGSVLAQTLGLRLTGGTDPSKEIFIGKSAAARGYTYMRVTREGTSDVFNAEYWRGTKRTGKVRKVSLPFLARQIDAHVASRQ